MKKIKELFSFLSKKLPKPIQKLFKKRWFVIVFCSVLLLLLLISLSNRNKPKQSIVSITKGDVISEVSLTGTVKPTSNIDYAFVSGGRISKIYFKTGDKVKANQTLITLENLDVYSQYEQALASLKIQEIKLENYYKGTRAEDLKVAQNQYDDALQKMNIAYKNMYSTLFSAYNTTNSLILNDLNPILNYIGVWEATTPQYNSSFRTCHNANLNSPLILRKNFDKTLSIWQSDLNSLTNSSQATILDQSFKEKEYLDSAYELINSVNSILDPNCNLQSGTERTQIESYKTTALSIQTSIESLRASFLQSKSSLDSLILAYNNAKQNLDIKNNPYTPQDIATQKAIVDQARASANSAYAVYSKTVLKAPFDGVITKIVPSVGNIVSANTTVISLIGGDTYEIEVNIAESDISKVKVGNTAKVTLDAYSSDVFFTATVIQVDLSASVSDGVATYRAILKFNKEDPRIMPGMTANIDILSQKKENVIFVKSRAIITKNGKKFVKLIKNKKTIETNVILGIRGSDGRTEVISGLNIGDQILSQ